MTKNLIIVESYTKTKTISKYLNSNNNNKYIVTFSQGHFCDLPKDSLGIDINTWKAEYIITKKKLLIIFVILLIMLIIFILLQILILKVKL